MQRYCLFSGLLWALTMAVSAQTNAPAVRTLSLAECLQIALEHNLGVQIERITPEIAKHNLSLAYAGYDPAFRVGGNHSFSLSPGGFDPTTGLLIPGSTADANSFSAGLGGLTPLGMTYSLGSTLSESYGMQRAFPFDESRGSASINLRQPLLKNFWIDGTRMNIQISRKNLKSSELTLRDTLMRTINSVEQAYYSLIYAQENVKVQEMALTLAEQTFKENRRRVQVGTMAPLDEKQAEYRVADQRSTLLSAQQALAIQQNALKNLLSDNYTDWQNQSVVPAEALTAPVQVFSLQDSWLKGMTMRPVLLQARIEVEKQNITLRYNRNQLFPQLDLVGSYGHSGGNTAEFSGVLDDLRRGNGPFYTYGAELVIPLENRSARYQYKNSKANQQRLLLQLKQLEQNIMVEIDDAVKQAQTQFQRVDATRQARLYAEAALDAEQKKFEAGKSTNFFVLDLQSKLTAARSAEIGALADYNKALASLALAEGTLLERHQINLAVQ